MVELCVVENEPIILELNAEAAAALRATGQEMASTAIWWGDRSMRGKGSVIDVQVVGPDRYQVVFRDVVGVIRLEGRQIEVVPKIPVQHFLYLAARGAVGARYAHLDVNVAPSTRLVDVLAAWLVRAAEWLLNRGLRVDYQSYQDELQAAQGEILFCDTTMSLLRGRPVVHCLYDELSDDAPMNRVVKAACIAVAANTVVPATLSARARRAAARFVDVGRLQPNDVRAEVDRVNNSYAQVFPLALLVLQGLGLSSASGRHRGSAFLIRTPELIEAGLRSVMQDALPDTVVTKRRFLLGDTGLSMNPDVVFGHNEAVGDVKYRYLKKDWNRSDLNQVVAFAAAAQCCSALLVGLATNAAMSLPRDVPVGDIRVRCLAWIADSALGIDENLKRFSGALRNWRQQMTLCANAG
jgi:5-methylcytosine-specific restriction endonuclease McrBC regulatory subunit McrC